MLVYFYVKIQLDTLKTMLFKIKMDEMVDLAKKVFI